MIGINHAAIAQRSGAYIQLHPQLLWLGLVATLPGLVTATSGSREILKQYAASPVGLVGLLCLGLALLLIANAALGALVRSTLVFEQEQARLMPLAALKLAGAPIALPLTQLQLVSWLFSLLTLVVVLFLGGLLIFAVAGTATIPGSFEALFTLYPVLFPFFVLLSAVALVVLVVLAVQRELAVREISFEKAGVLVSLRRATAMLRSQTPLIFWALLQWLLIVVGISLVSTIVTDPLQSTGVSLIASGIGSILSWFSEALIFSFTAIYWTLQYRALRYLEVVTLTKPEERG